MNPAQPGINWAEIGALAGILVPIGAIFIFIVNAMIDNKFNVLLEKLDERYAGKEVTDLRVKLVEKAEEVRRAYEMRTRS